MPTSPSSRRLWCVGWLGGIERQEEILGRTDAAERGLGFQALLGWGRWHGPGRVCVVEEAEEHARRRRGEGQLFIGLGRRSSPSRV